MIVSLVCFRSTLSAADVQARFEQRAGRYAAVPGLVEKIYLRFHETGEFGAIYVWESEEALARFAESDLAATIPGVYGTTGVPRTELADVRLIVRPGSVVL